MKVYRIAKTQHIDDLSGTGAQVYGGRWNHKGMKILYTSENRALATVEFLVHLPFSSFPDDLSLVTLQFPDEISSKKISISDLPDNWREYPAPLKLADIATNWVVRKEALLLYVPSVVVEHEFNILINPSHPDMKHVAIFQIEPYKIDKRLLRKTT